MVVIGLTGSIGMGKSTAARMLRRLGVPVYDSDAAVHRLYARGGAAAAPIAAAFPEAVRDGAVDRGVLARLVQDKPQALHALELIVHPLVEAETRRFLWTHALRRTPVVALDVPLFFEAGRDADLVVVVSAPPAVQRARVLARPGMTEAKFDAIRARQLPDREKRRRADVAVPTGLGRRPALQALRRAVMIARAMKGGRVWPPRAPATRGPR